MAPPETPEPHDWFVELLEAEGAPPPGPSGTREPEEEMSPDFPEEMAPPETPEAPHDHHAEPEDFPAEVPPVAKRRRATYKRPDI